MLQTVLNSTKCGTLGGYLLDSFLDGFNSILSIGIICSINLQTVYTKPLADIASIFTQKSDYWM